MSRLKKLKKPILVCYLPVGDPLLLPGQAALYAEQGVDVFEVGIPSRDPFLDGAVVRDSMFRAIAAGIKPQALLRQCAALREQHPDQALVLMGYGELLPPQAHTGAAVYCDGLLEIGVSGPVDGAGTVSVVPRICFVPFEVPEQSVTQAVRATGYVMLQAAAGKTGRRDNFDNANAEHIARLREAGVQAPILLGVGISCAEHVRRALECGADGVIVGSAVLERMAEGQTALRHFLASLRRALNGTE